MVIMTQAEQAQRAQRAKQLLLEYLDDAQRASYRHTGSFAVCGNYWRHWYRVIGTQAGHVHELAWLPHGRPSEYIRVVRQAYVPDYRTFPLADQMLAIKLMIETNEQQFCYLTCIRKPCEHDVAAARGEGPYIVQ